jgi:hypothetical protein
MVFFLTLYCAYIWQPPHSLSFSFPLALCHFSFFWAFGNHSSIYLFCFSFLPQTLLPSRQLPVSTNSIDSSAHIWTFFLFLFFFSLSLSPPSRLPPFHLPGFFILFLLFYFIILLKLLIPPMFVLQISSVHFDVQ